jgi:exosortase A-associated hydrolase 1
MNYTEIPVLFDCAGETLPGLCALPEAPLDCGVLIVVGGPQYRTGSHRQFLLLSRRLAAAGHPVFRFDSRGMGDATGAMRSFEDISGDIEAAIGVFRRQCPRLARVVLWGLCDAASAILMYAREKGDPCVHGLALLNPWARSEEGLAQTRVRHYYGQRLTQREFWRKLLAGKLDAGASLRAFLENAGRAWRRPADGGAAPSFRERMAEGWRRFEGGVLLILSGRDYTAKEFIEQASRHPAWAGLLQARNVSRVDLPDADHTFSSAAWRARVEDETLRWLATLRESGGAR